MPSIEKMEKAAVDLNRQAEVYLVEGRLNEAVAACESALKIEPNLAVACQTLGKVMQVQGEVEQAKQWYEAALDRNPNLPEVYANLGSLYSQGKQWEKAIASCEKAIALAPNFAAAYRLLAKIWMQLDRRAQAADCWYQAFKIEPNWATAEEYVTLGNSLVELGKLDRATECYSQAIELDPQLATAYHNMGEMLVAQKRWDEAIANYRQAIAINPDSFESYHSLGQTWAERGEGDRAIACYRKSIELNPNYARAYLGLGNVFVQKGEFDEAIQCYRQTLAINNNSYWAHNYLGEAFAHKKLWQEAVISYRKAIELNSDIPWFYCNLGIALTCEKSWDEAVAAFLRAIQLEPNLRGINQRLGYVLRKRSESGLDSTIATFCQGIEALGSGEFFHKLLKIELDGSDFFINLGNSLAKQKQLEGAIVFYSMAVQIEPNAAEVVAQLKEVRAQQQELYVQIANYRSQIAIDPTNSKAYNDLGNILPQLGELEEAIVCHQQASALRGWPECAQKDYQFTQDWFTHNIPIWQRHLQPLTGIADFQVVEIGSFQGMSACWLLDNILTHQTAKITCIDLYFQETFKGNIVKTGVGEKVIELEGYSQDLLVNLDSEFYDIAYVDGCHKPTSALQDAILSWRLVKVGGLMIFDDYQFTFPDSPEQDTKIGIDVFLEMFGSQLKLVHKGYQLIVKKIGNESLGEEQTLLSLGWEKLGNIAADAGYVDEAIERYQTAIKIKSGNYSTYHKLGKSLQEKEMFERGAAAYQQAIALNPNFSWSYHFLGETWQVIEQYGEAAAAYRKAIELNPNFCWTYNNLGDVLMELSEWEEAVVSYRKLIELNPDFCWSYDRLGKALIAVENWEEAAAAYRKAIELNPDDCWLYNSLGEVLESLENWSEAAVAFARAVELEPEHSWLYKKLGDALREQGELERAIAIYEQGINVDPNSCWCYEGLGLIFIAQQQWDKAISNLVQTLQIKPDLFGIYYHIAYTLEQQGEVDQADIIRLGYKMLPLSFLQKHCGFTDDLAVTAESEPNITCIDIYPASEINLSDSRTIHSNSKCWQDEIFYIKKSFVATIPKGRAWADIATTAVITSDNKLVTDISMGCPELVITSDKLSPVEHIEGNVAFLSARWGGAAYFHWMFDVVTRFELLQRCGLIDTIDKFVINACDLSYEKESLNTLGIPLDKILESRYQQHFTADKLIVPSICDGASGTSKWKCEYLKRIFLNQDNSQNTKYSKRIYISRNRASYRRIVNDEEVVAYLEKIGFSTVKLEMMSVAEQAACLAAAEVVVAPHGGGLTNLVFCSPGTKVIEIFSPIYVPTCFWTISNLCELEHYYLIAELFDDQTHKYSGHKDMRVDMNSLEKLMNIAGVVHE
ncbi:MULTISPECIES: tetratricopeptide repeat protein [unclassified Microcoleus]|uniref:tetratricopeptide repeat protein n=1 Tax=unclassified Microcoleus TaxID=2642155 RepID=UPI001D3FFB10|nr:MULTISPECIES: tetratricopeptide repeat protein [unclassified Microcoleus]MCC3414668.1 tetratricopeptide repeat protein [Microcoleus sp. PH2017_02_FOX_O_A]MCC3518902.1 tetratricopeptide repeat protein [Microcoleus sp. PH2017_18_LLB_O_A]